MKLLPVALATSSIIGCLSPKQTQLNEKYASETVKSLENKERQKQILEDLKAKGIHDEAHHQWFVVSEVPTNKEIIEVAKNNNMFFVDPHALMIMVDDESIVKELDAM